MEEREVVATVVTATYNNKTVPGAQTRGVATTVKIKKAHSKTFIIKLDNQVLQGIPQLSSVVSYLPLLRALHRSI